jgi:hypothetical protein
MTFRKWNEEPGGTTDTVETVAVGLMHPGDLPRYISRAVLCRETRRISL